MQVLACDNAITLTPEGLPECTTGWLSVDSAAFHQEPLSVEDFDQLWGWAMLLIVMAFGWRTLRGQFEKRG